MNGSYAGDARAYSRELFATNSNGGTNINLKSVHDATVGSMTSGLLEFRIGNNHPGGNQVACVRESLLGKLPGGSSPNGDHGSIAKGVRTSSRGSQLDQSGGMTTQVTRRTGDKGPEQGKFMLQAGGKEIGRDAPGAWPCFSSIAREGYRRFQAEHPAGITGVQGVKTELSMRKLRLTSDRPP